MRASIRSMRPASSKSHGVRRRLRKCLGCRDQVREHRVSTFQYRAYTKHGVVTSGTIVAEELDAAIEALYGSGLTPVETVPCAESERPAASRSIERSAPGLPWSG